MKNSNQHKPTVKRPRKPKLIIPPTRGKAEIIPHDGDYVTVCCKHPSGLKLRVFEMVEQQEQGPHGTRAVKVAQQIGGSGNYVLIRGYNKSVEHFQGGLVNPGYATTKNVPAAFWSLWLKQNADSDMVLNHLIWAHKQEASVKSFARDNERNLCGLEPLTPTPPGSPFEPPPKAVDPRLKGLRMAPTTASRDA